MEKKTPPASSAGPNYSEPSPANRERTRTALSKREQVVLVTIREWDKISVKAFIVAGKFKSGMYDFDKNYVYLPLTVAQELVGLKDKGR